MPLDKALKLGIDKFKENNEFIKDLISKKNNDIDEVILHLHNSYYKTKYKDYNSF